MKSKNVWVIAIEAMNIIAVIGWRIVKAGSDKIIIAIRFVWMPGIRPVIVPADTPMRRASISSSNILPPYEFSVVNLLLLPFKLKIVGFKNLVQFGFFRIIGVV